MKRSAKLFVAALFPLFLPLSVNGEVLVTTGVASAGGGLFGEPIPSRLRLVLDIGGEYFGGVPGGTVFDLPLGPSDVGSSFVVSSGSEFEEAVAYLTNGINDAVSIEYAGLGLGITESFWLFGDTTGARGDLAGAHIDNITLSVAQLTFSETRPGWIEHELRGIVTINGTPPIPEPETYALMMVGLAGLGAVVRKRRKTEEPA